MTRIKDVATDAQVSVATVSYVLNKNKYVSPELTEKVMDSVKRLNYSVNPVARSLRNKKTKAIGVVLQNISNVFFPQILSGLEEYVKENEYTLQFVNTYNDIAHEKQAITSLKNMWMDGIILDSCVDDKDKKGYLSFLNESAGKNTPIVLLERSLDDKVYSAVIADNYAGGMLATNHLIEQGKDRIVHITLNRDWNMILDRTRAYRDAMKQSGLERHIAVRYGNLQAQDGYEIMKEFFKQDSRINGAFAINDQLAIGAMKAVYESGRKIPDDFALVGYDNIFASSILETPLTTINVPKYEMGKLAGKILIDIINGKRTEPEVITLPLNLIVRLSTDLRGEKNWELYGW